MATSSQRVYRAACPNCGAPVEFASAASASAVCSFCRSTLLRDGDTLRRIGVSAELFDDHSPLQLGTSGTRQGTGFVLVGRLQYATGDGATPDATWNEWHALFDNGRSAWLSEDNGAYVFAFDAPLPADAPSLDGLRAGQRVMADGRAWSVASVVQARLLAAQGELPRPPKLEGRLLVADLRNSAGEVATLDALDAAHPRWSVGRSVPLSELALQGLKADDGGKTLSARGLECPNCGAALQPTLASTKSLTCSQCQSVVDISAGAGADLQHYQQNNAGTQGAEPQIALGRTGTLLIGATPLPWQVVGYQERCDIPGPGDDEETRYWREYLLYNRTAGFAFLVDSNEGWSWVRPLTGAPEVRGDIAQWDGKRYARRWDYAAQVTWVQGEFYWRVQRDERARVTDYEAGNARLSREQTAGEVTWSAGETLDARAVATAFGIAPGGATAALQRDAAPLSFGGWGGSWRTVLIVAVLLIVLVLLLSRCSSDGCDEVRQTFGEASSEYQQCRRSASSGSGARSGSYGSSGGSYGGWSSGGGGHK